MANFALWNRCNSNCIMCTNPPGFKRPENSKAYTMQKVIARIKREKYKIKPNEIIHFSGGEPTIHPNFMEVIRWTRKEFPENQVVFATNGRRLAYNKFTKELLKTRNMRMEVAILGDNAALHDAITRSPGSFQQTITGLENLFQHKKPDHFVEIRIVLIKPNYKRLDKICEFIFSKFPKAERVVVIFPELEGWAEKNIQQVGITYKQVRLYVEKATKRWADSFREFLLYHFPLCTLDYAIWQYTRRSLDKEAMVFTKSCHQCAYKDSCLGIHPEYAKNIGVDEFFPIKEKIKKVEANPKNYCKPIIKS